MTIQQALKDIETLSKNHVELLALTGEILTTIYINVNRGDLPREFGKLCEGFKKRYDNIECQQPWMKD